MDCSLSPDENGRQAGGHVSDQRTGAGQGILAPADAEGAQEREDLPADVPLRAAEAENEARSGDQVGQGGRSGFERDG